MGKKKAIKYFGSGMLFESCKSRVFFVDFFITARACVPQKIGHPLCTTDISESSIFPIFFSIHVTKSRIL